MRIVLIGDSILDNKSYVDEGESVEQLLKNELPEYEVTLLAADGALTTDIHTQILDFPHDASHVFFSCGGNDAIDNSDILNRQASTVEDALLLLTNVRERFRRNYVSALNAVRNKDVKMAAFTVYNKIPELDEASKTALALFNEVILEELAATNTTVVDLRVIFSSKKDYSSVSPIEPSLYGGSKIVNVIKRVIASDFRHGTYI